MISPNSLIYQTLLSDYPHRHKNRMELDRINSLINKLALRISGDLEYQEVVDYICKLITDITLPNSVLSTLEFELFKYRYFWWANHELKNKGFDDPKLYNKYSELFKR